MDAALPADWLERVAESLCAHEERQDRLQHFPPRYEVLDEISRGGMGIVYRAWDPQLGRNVALKVLRSEDGGSAAEAHERFQREARLAANLHHPNIVPIYDTGTFNGQDYIAMQLIEGRTLDRAKPDRRQALAYVRDAARALQHAHEQGIVHRDIKPSNLMVDGQGRVFVADFGIARQAVATAGMTSPGTIVGTPAYMSPEQAQGLPADARSDVYSLGATLYELLTGRAPYTGEPLDVVDAVRTKDPDSARRLVTDLSKNVEAILAGAMERRPADRYPSASALADDIDRYLKGERPLRRPRGLSYKVRREFVRHPWRSSAAILLGLLLFGAGVLGGYYLRARHYREKAKVTRDPQLKAEYLKIAAPFFPDAADDLVATLRAIEEARAPKQEPGRPPREPVPERHPAPASDAPVQRPAEPDPVAEALAKKPSEVRTLIAAGNYEDARREIDELAGKAPDRVVDLKVELLRAEFDAGMRRLEELAAKSEDPEFQRVFRRLQGEAYQGLVDRQSRLGPVAFRRAQALADARKWSESVAWFGEAESLEVRKPELFEQRGLALLQLQEWDKAQKDLDRLMAYSKGRTTYPPAFAVLAYRREHQALLEKSWTEAVTQAEIALHFDAKHALAYHDRGLARYGSTRQAERTLEEDLRSALDADPALIPDSSYREILVAYARAQGERYWNVDAGGEREAAWRKPLAWLDLGLQRYFPNDPDLLVERAVLKRRLNELGPALTDARTALKAKADSRTHALLGSLIFLQGRLPKPDDAKTREAILSLTEALRLEPDNAQALSWRGIARRDLGDSELEGAIQDLQQALKLRPTSPFLALQLAGARLDRMARDSDSRDWQQAVDEAARAALNADALSDEDMIAGFYELRRLPKSQAVKFQLRESRLTRAQAFNQGGDFARSIQECTAAIAADPDFRLAYLWRGSALCSQRDHPEAQADFRTALKLSKTEEERKSSEKWLNRCLKHGK